MTRWGGVGMKTLVSLIFVFLWLVSGCKGDAEPPAVVEPILEDLVIQNCYIVQAAADAFAAQNGIYPATVQQFQPFLPNGQLLENPFTGLESDPVNGVAAIPGQTGYLPIPSATGAVGYTISGYGELGLIIQFSFDSRDP